MNNCLSHANLIIVRHGLSIYNLENRFTGWLNIPLNSEGIQEAKTVGARLKDYKMDVAYTSKLKRAIQWLWLMVIASEPFLKNNHISDKEIISLNIDTGVQIYQLDKNFKIINKIV